jgi:uncharacterized lipoprotein YddW (UPF0748 family)
VTRLVIIGSLVVGMAFNTLAAELRGLWVDAFGPGFLDKQQVSQLAEHCRKYNFNVVFVEMRKRGDAFYSPHAPNEDPRTLDVKVDFDALAEIIRECHESKPRIEVHCWLLAYFVWAMKTPPPQPEHVFNRHADWFTKNSIGQPLIEHGYYLDPGHPDVQAALVNTAKDVVSHYDIDGLHWDYLRYPDQDSGYNETALLRYKAEFQIKENPLPDNAQFCEWRRRQITDFVRWSTAELLVIKPKLIVSAAVFSNYKDSSIYRLADWAAWNREGIIDFSVPMDFSPDNRFVFNPRADFALTNQGPRAVYVGQGAYMNKKENTLTQLQYCREKGFKGTVLYSYRNPEGEKAVPGTAISIPENQTNSVELIVDNEDAKIIGEWRSGKFGNFLGNDYAFKENGAEKDVVEFTTKLPMAGSYEVFEWHVAGANRTEDARFVVTGTRTNAVAVNQQRNDGKWNSLGIFSFSSNATVRVMDNAPKENQVVVADALRFVFVSTNTVVPALVETPKISVAEEMRANQETAFTFLKEKFQPTWENVPSLPWKTNQTIIKGTVTDTRTGQPVYNAVVAIDSSPERTQKTEAHGKFAFFDVLSGRRIVTFRTSDQAPLEKREIEIKVGEIVSLDVAISPK